MSLQQLKQNINPRKGEFWRAEDSRGYAIWEFITDYLPGTNQNIFMCNGKFENKLNYLSIDQCCNWTKLSQEEIDSLKAQLL